MKQAWILFGFVLVMAGTVVGCDSGQTGGGAKKAGTAPDAPLATPASQSIRPVACKIPSTATTAIFVASE